jgi:hypothetical protein
MFSNFWRRLSDDLFNERVPNTLPALRAPFMVTLALAVALGPAAATGTDTHDDAHNNK